MTNPETPTKHIMDGTAVVVAGTTLAGWLPSIAALFTIVWTGLRIYESQTVQGWLAKRKR